MKTYLKTILISIAFLILTISSIREVFLLPMLAFMLHDASYELWFITVPTITKIIAAILIFKKPKTSVVILGITVAYYFISRAIIHKTTHGYPSFFYNEVLTQVLSLTLVFLALKIQKPKES
jgi:uncharacterized membrane protein HdeD (DUF308 family)